MATVYSDQGCGIRPPVVFYNRANEAAQMLRVGDFDWDAIFPRCRWFHTGGLFTALGDEEFILDAMKKVSACKLGVGVDNGAGARTPPCSSVDPLCQFVALRRPRNTAASCPTI